LRIEEQILKFGRDAGVESDAIANESAVILQAAREMAFAGGFHGAGKIGEGLVVDFEGNGLDAVRRIAKRHFSRVPEKAEARDVRDRVDALCAGGIIVHLLQREGGIAIQSLIAATAAASDSSVARSFFNAVVMTPVPRGLVKSKTSPARAPTFRQTRCGLMTPVTA